VKRITVYITSPSAFLIPATLDMHPALVQA
jgi:hypothetical protein